MFAQIHTLTIRTVKIPFRKNEKAQLLNHIEEFSFIDSIIDLDIIG